MFLLFGFGIWFWAIILVEFCLLTWFVEEEWGIASLVSLAAFILCLWWLADIPIWEWIKNNPARLGMYCLYYVLIGLGWSVGKYYFVLNKMRKYVKEKKEHWLANKEKYENVQTFKQYLEQTRDNWSNNKTDFEKSTKKLVFWAAFWPTSMFWTILNDPIRKLFKFLIHDVFIGIYRTMYKKMIGDLIEKD